MRVHRSDPDDRFASYCVYDFTYVEVVGLVSGGKDSCYNLMKCVEAGDEIVCLAHLRPPDGTDELDSYMYQSVAHEALHLYAEAWGLPLYQEVIRGRPVALQMDYELTADDEVEDLFRLLQRVLQHHPDVAGVSAGAIHSTYQKKRVEHVCARLALTPRCPLWGREQCGLLREMLAAGVEGLLVKVACLGLGEAHVGRRLADVADELVALSASVGANACGEGGEFESFVTDCPLFRRRVVVDRSHVVRLGNDPFSPVLYLKIDRCHLEEK